MQYRLRPEWAPQRGVFLVWPHAESDWRDTLSQIQSWYAQLIAELSATESIYLLCQDSKTEQDCRRCLDDYPVNQHQVHILIVPSNDTWIRDFGPLSLSAIDGLSDPEFLWLNFRFNAWGGKYDYALDNQVCDQLAKQTIAQPMRQIDWILEGGAIDINEDGILITTANCILNQNRNVFDRPQIEQRLKDVLGASQILILESGFLSGDDTDSHVDNLVRFSDNQTLLYCSCDDTGDVHYQSLQSMRQQIEHWNRQLASPFTLVPIPLPDPVYGADGDRLAASYLNFLILNHVVVVPVYHDNDMEKNLLEKFAELFPHRSIFPIASRDLVAQGGGPHCASMQFS